MNQAARRLLRELQDRGLDGVPRSRIPRTCHALVDELQTCKAVKWRSSGGGHVLCVTHALALNAVIERYFPMGLDDPLDEVVDRATAVLAAGDAKQARRGACEAVFVRSVRSGAVVRSVDGAKELPVGDLTATAGGAAIVLDDDHKWSFAGTVAVIENAEAFWRHDRVLDVDLAIYSAGRMSSKRLLDWLASPLMKECIFVHWGDYDPIGAAEYLRLLNGCPSRVRMHFPEDLESLLTRYGNRDLLLKQMAVFDQIRGHVDNPTIERLIKLCGLFTSIAAPPVPALAEVATDQLHARLITSTKAQSVLTTEVQV